MDTSSGRYRRITMAAKIMEKAGAGELREFTAPVLAHPSRAP